MFNFRVRAYSPGIQPRSFKALSITKDLAKARMGKDLLAKVDSTLNRSKENIMAETKELQLDTWELEI